MATETQINANRLNSQKSTGPRTDEGKAAVSQNALKHGLFAHEAVVMGENQAEFDLYRSAMVGELWPVGVMESMLAERIVSLSWRMRRAERMQNQATDCMILEEVKSGMGYELKKCYREVNGISKDDPRASEEPLLLGRVATKQWSDNTKMLERLFMHERRIESSMHKTINKLKKLQIMRRIEREDAEEKSVAQTAPAQDHNGDFVKQSQFAPSVMGATPFTEKRYDDIARPEAARNKPNQSQFQTQRRPSLRAKGEIAPALRASQ